MSGISVFDIAQPVIDQAKFSVFASAANTAAAIVPANDNVRYLQYFHPILENRQTV